MVHKREKMLFDIADIDLSGVIDVRSDVVTQPTPEMLEYLVKAEVGNDGWREDPTVNLLEKEIAKMFGKESALITPSGTMANQIALRLLCPPGNEAIVERRSHIYNFEAAGSAVLSGIQLNPISGKDGILNWKDIEPNIRPPFHQFSKTSLISLENTHNSAGGKIYPIKIIREISHNAKELGISMHLDGARILNASVATNVPVREYAKNFDLITTCLSKSLGCPGGSLLIGTEKLIEKALYIRRQLGGSMRQIAGYMAACGLFALEHNIERLKEDHYHAKIIAEAIDNSSRLKLLSKPETNIILFISTVKEDPERIIRIFRDNSVLIAHYDYPNLRMVTHLGISKENVYHIIDVIEKKFN